jgi:hypothetical protein
VTNLTGKRDEKGGEEAQKALLFLCTSLQSDKETLYGRTTEGPRIFHGLHSALMLAYSIIRYDIK